MFAHLFALAVLCTLSNQVLRNLRNANDNSSFWVFLLGTKRFRGISSLGGHISSRGYPGACGFGGMHAIVELGRNF